MGLVNNHSLFKCKKSGSHKLPIFLLWMWSV